MLFVSLVQIIPNGLLNSSEFEGLLSCQSDLRYLTNETYGEHRDDIETGDQTHMKITQVEVLLNLQSHLELEIIMGL